MRRQSKTYLISEELKKTSVCDNCKKNEVEEANTTEDTIKDGNGKAPLPYKVPPNSSSSKIYVPLIKNTIKREEMRWKDGYTFSEMTSSAGWANYVLAGIELIKSKTGITSEGFWLSTPPTGKIAVPYAILGDGLPLFGRMEQISAIHLAQYRNPLFTITDSMTIIFSGLSWGYAFLTRLIDDRIQNSAGKSDPQAVCYSPTAHVIKTTCQGWYNIGTQHRASSSNKTMWYNLCMRGQVTLLYDWNRLHLGDNVVLLVTIEETYNYND